MRFPIGEERVTCYGSKLTNSLGRPQPELSTRTWSGRALWNRGKFVCQWTWYKKAMEVGKRFSLEKAFAIREKRFIITKTYQINKKGANLDFLCLQKWIAHVRQLALWSASPGRKVVVSFTTKYAVFRQWDPEFSSLALVEEAKATLALSSFFVSCEEKGCCRVISVGQLVSTAGRIGGHSHRRRQANNVFVNFFLVWVGRKTRHLMTSPSGNSEFCLSSILNTYLKHWGCWGNKHCFPWGQGPVI